MRNALHKRRKGENALLGLKRQNPALFEEYGSSQRKEEGAMATKTRTRQGTAEYLAAFADDMKKIAQGAMLPSLALLFDMAGDEARNYQRRLAAEAEKAGNCGGVADEGSGSGKRAACGTVRSALRGKPASLRQSRNHAAMMTNNAPRKLKLHQTEIKA